MVKVELNAFQRRAGGFDQAIQQVKGFQCSYRCRINFFFVQIVDGFPCIAKYDSIYFCATIIDVIDNVLKERGFIANQCIWKECPYVWHVFEGQFAIQ
ncbi:hypothetical protein D3C80_1530620 [compost metagenome]